MLRGLKRAGIPIGMHHGWCVLPIIAAMMHATSAAVCVQASYHACTTRGAISTVYAVKLFRNCNKVALFVQFDDIKIAYCYNLTVR
ncbi:hypothetical protein HMPREF9248_0336 [Fannyhessea vaginae PB189-T1-4]|uniref:Secreted protein n=1 Tax=Fannyhessea vaginae PB189-T1-4 TaxID=866774 RepID=A0ABP2IYC8_9ACTN|nr:hypothetical protein HMPREF9248_0336 [Fannyhessea vaginae PB189-T1-4]